LGLANRKSTRLGVARIRGHSHTLPMGTPEFVLLLGGPGSGKGTQALQLARHLAIPHISSGDLLRAHRQQGTQLGRRAQAAMDLGDLVPDALVEAMLLDRLTAPDTARGALLDGFPRDVSQAEVLDRTLGAQHAALRAIYLEVPADALVSRLAGRRTCPTCRASFHVDANPPRQPDVCDGCGAALVQRSDDCPEVVSHRVAVYLRETLPVVEHYQRLGVLRTVDGNRPIDVISADMRCDIDAHIACPAHPSSL
jgi:adenylate kinase